jgi:ferric-chelate reductase
MESPQIWIHVSEAIPYAIATAGIYVLDLFLRTIKSHITQATIHFVPEMTSTRVSIRNVSRGWRAGQHVRLTVLSTGMGLGVIESHPFTIASASGDDEGLILYCKKAGDWTAKLGTLAEGGITAKSSEAGFGAGRNVSVIVQGPYGGPGHVVFSSYSAAMIVSGGSGITFGLAAVKEIMRDAFDKRCHVRLVDLIWVVRDPSAYSIL